MTPYVTYNNEIGVRLSFLISPDPKLEHKYKAHPESLCAFSPSCYEKKAARNKSFKLRSGKGEGNEVLIRWNMLNEHHAILIKKFGNPKVEHNPMEEYFELDAKARLWFEGHTYEDDGSHLEPPQISQYTLNASVLNALIALHQARKAEHKIRQGTSRGIWASCVNDCNLFNDLLKVKYQYGQHTLPKNERRLADACKAYTAESYAYLLDRRGKNQNAAKIKTEVHLAMLEQMLKKHNNYDNEQIARFYNIAATKMQWKTITHATVANYRQELGLYTYAGRRGATNFRNKKSMQIKRTAPSASMVYWTLDGWDAELLYQREEMDKNGHKKITYHNRLTVVVVLDPVAGLKYPIGYAIGTHETPELIQEAMRNAANHTRELFGSRFKPLQLQSDHYAIKTLMPLYEAMTKHFTPARVSNAKAKVIEPYFLRLNKMCQTFYKNWSGFGVTAEKENQPNQDYLNKIRHSFPDEQGCREQITRLIELERSEKAKQYLELWYALPDQDKLPLTNAEYLYLFGETHEYTNKIQSSGFTPTLLGQEVEFDSFDTRFRELAYMDWAIKYDPTDIRSILVLNAKNEPTTKRVKEIVGTYRFELTAKYIQPMALYDRKEGDAAERQKVEDFNQQLEQKIIDRGQRNSLLLEKTFIENPQLNDTLTKMVLTDSKGQHKDNRNKSRKISQPKPKAQLPQPEGDFEIMDEDVRTEYGNSNN